MPHFPATPRDEFVVGEDRYRLVRVGDYLKILDERGSVFCAVDCRGAEPSRVAETLMSAFLRLYEMSGSTQCRMRVYFRDRVETHFRDVINI